jgi:dTDP-glucose 4,6-dehydratase
MNIRDWIYVEDHCSAVDFVLHNGSSAGEIYNIDGGNELTNLEITHRLLKMLGKDESSIEYVEDRKGHDFRYSLDGSKLEKWAGNPDMILIPLSNRQSNGMWKTNGGGSH